MIVHGTINSYKRHKCRCELCKAAYSKYQKAHKDKSRASKLGISEEEVLLRRSIKDEPVYKFIGKLKP